MHTKLAHLTPKEVCSVTSIVRDIVEEAMSNPDPFGTIRMAQAYIHKEALHPSSSQYVMHITERMMRARGIVKLFENKYGVNYDTDQTRIARPSDLYCDLLKRYVPQEGMQIISHNILFGIILPDYGRRQAEKKTSGIAQGYLIDPLAFPLERTARRIASGQRMNYDGMCYRMPTMDKWTQIHGPSAREMRISTIAREFGEQGDESWTQIARSSYVETQRHETRHVLDLIIGHRSIFTEAAADLYAERTISGGLKRDVKVREERPSQRYGLDRIKQMAQEIEIAYTNSEVDPLLASYLLSIVPEEDIPRALMKMSQV